jgi:hypothetical protein
MKPSIALKSSESIADVGNARTAAALKRLTSAMTAIEAEIAVNHGVYPFNHGRVTQSELCRRADVKKATLQNPLHKDTTRVQIMRWLDGLNAGLSHARDSTRERVTAIADSLSAEVERLTLALREAHGQLAIAREAMSAAQKSPEPMASDGAETGYSLGTCLKHYKGGLYTVVGSCLIEATLKPGVLYKPLQGDLQYATWMRPLEEFGELVATPQGLVTRFAVVEAT